MYRLCIAIVSISGSHLVFVDRTRLKCSQSYVSCLCGQTRGSFDELWLESMLINCSFCRSQVICGLMLCTALISDLFCLGLYRCRSVLSHFISTSLCMPFVARKSGIDFSSHVGHAYECYFCNTCWLKCKPIMLCCDAASVSGSWMILICQWLSVYGTSKLTTLLWYHVFYYKTY